MKLVKISLAILISTALLISCKKKDSTTTTTTTNSTTGTPVHVNSMTAKVNGADWAMLNNQSVSASSISKFSGTYQFSGQTAFTNPYTAIALSFPTSVTPGTYTLGNGSSNYYAIYTDNSNNSFASISGTLNISTLDTVPTSQGIFNKFKATYSFVTNTVAFTSTVTSTSYSITNGVVDYEKQ